MTVVGVYSSDSSSPRNAVETRVRDLILKVNTEPEKIKFEKWGPHLYRREWDGMLHLADSIAKSKANGLIKNANFECIVRLVYKAPHRVVVGQASSTQLPDVQHDELFIITKDTVDLIAFQSGDDWKDRLEALILHQPVESKDKDQLEKLKLRQMGK
jgi:hypothetical protein